MKKPLVSLIAVSYNHEKYLINSLEFLINQTYNNIELILIDDGSSDNTFSKINSIKEKLYKRFKMVFITTKKNQRVTKTLNLGLKIAKGDYIIFFSTDDFVQNKNRKTN